MIEEVTIKNVPLSCFGPDVVIDEWAWWGLFFPSAGREVAGVYRRLLEGAAAEPLCWRANIGTISVIFTPLTQQFCRRWIQENVLLTSITVHFVSRLLGFASWSKRASYRADLSRWPESQWDPVSPRAWFCGCSHCSRRGFLASVAVSKSRSLFLSVLFVSAGAHSHSSNPNPGCLGY